MTEERKSHTCETCGRTYNGRSKEESLGWYTARRAALIFRRVEEATLFTQFEVYKLAKKFIAWFEFSERPQQYKEKYIGKGETDEASDSD